MWDIRNKDAMTAEVWADAKVGCTAYRDDMEAYCGSNSGRGAEVAEVWAECSFRRDGNRRGEVPEVEEAYSRRVDSRGRDGCCRRVGSRCSDVNCCRYDCLSKSFRPYCRDGSAVRMLSEDVYCCCCARGFGRSSTQGSWIVIRPIRVLLSVSSVYCVNGGF